jgi:hypothetical protein
VKDEKEGWIGAVVSKKTTNGPKITLVFTVDNEDNTVSF